MLKRSTTRLVQSHIVKRIHKTPLSGQKLRGARRIHQGLLSVLVSQNTMRSREGLKQDVMFSKSSGIQQTVEHQPFVTDAEKASAELFLARLEQTVSQKKEDGTALLITDPEIIRQALYELGLDSASFKIEDADFRDFLRKVSSQPIDITALLQKIKSGLLENPAFCKLLAYIEENQAISSDELIQYSHMLKLQINLLCLFEALTVSMINSPSLAKNVCEHITKNRGVGNPGSVIQNFLFGVPFDFGLFIRLKLISVDPGMWDSVFRRVIDSNNKSETREEVELFAKKYGLTLWNRYIEPKSYTGDELDLVTMPGMAVNILEAAWHDMVSSSKDIGGRENAAAGLSLIALMEKSAELRDRKSDYYGQYVKTTTLLPKDVPVVDGDHYSLIPDLKLDTRSKKISQFRIDKEWMDLYNAWNFRFVLLSLDHRFIPLKLIIPSILSADPDNFKMARVPSLFLIGNLFLQKLAGKENPFFDSGVTFSKREQILTAFGKINRDYAEYVLKMLRPEITHSPEALLEQALGKKMPTFKFFKSLAQFAVDSDSFRVTSKSSTFKK